MEPAGEGSTILGSDSEGVKLIRQTRIGCGFSRINADEKEY